MISCMSVAKKVMLKEFKNKYGPKNVVLSPLSINVFLNMLASGSSGKTLEQFLGFLRCKDLDDLHSKSLTMMSLLVDTTQNSQNNTIGLDSVPKKRQGKPPLFNCVNALWADQVKNEVNSWVAKETKGLIKKILDSSEELWPPLCLANALYFKGDWVRIFKTASTRPQDFHLLNGETIKVPFMSEYNEYHQYGSFEDFQLLKLPYEIGQCTNMQFSMYIFLPRANDGLQDLIKKFDFNPTLMPQPWQFGLQEVELLKLKIPKMKFAYGFQVTELLKPEGLTLPFDQLHGDFTNMVDANPDNAFVGTIHHKACIEVNEEGSEAAAVTFYGIIGFARGRVPVQKPSFVADHPFMFMIVEEFSMLAVFAGAVFNPLLD
ncbi:hypothetical protein L484_021823 [Morus notabilis]|uniref:Serpin domain-containing protein n=1 Tax=Morus notabilis TaxID=981085 RepID=W9R3U8_9ROSA|nr:serpin-ZX [Morus notabilis]EXB37617.1 hypothetical protein L484_021823 [Morus notabilis]